ncbi:MAG: hypothetical protein J5836_03635 [Clostridia bacterium]|nr:hypothetical protein [Clostridia bacterium]
MIETIRQNPILLAGVIALILLIVAAIIVTALKLAKRKDNKSDERDIFLDAPAVKIKDEKPIEQTETGTGKKKKKADLAWLKDN